MPVSPTADDASPTPPGPALDIIASPSSTAGLPLGAASRTSRPPPRERADRLKTQLRQEELERGRLQALEEQIAYRQDAEGDRASLLRMRESALVDTARMEQRELDRQHRVQQERAREGWLREFKEREAMHRCLELIHADSELHEREQDARHMIALEARQERKLIRDVEQTEWYESTRESAYVGLHRDLDEADQARRVQLEQLRRLDHDGQLEYSLEWARHRRLWSAQYDQDLEIDERRRDAEMQREAERILSESRLDELRRQAQALAAAISEETRRQHNRLEHPRAAQRRPRRSQQEGPAGGGAGGGPTSTPGPSSTGLLPHPLAYRRLASPRGSGDSSGSEDSDGSPLRRMREEAVIPQQPRSTSPVTAAVEAVARRRQRDREQEEGLRAQIHSDSKALDRELLQQRALVERLKVAGVSTPAAAGWTLPPPPATPPASRPVPASSTAARTPPRTPVADDGGAVPPLQAQPQGQQRSDIRGGGSFSATRDRPDPQSAPSLHPQEHTPLFTPAAAEPSTEGQLAASAGVHVLPPPVRSPSPQPPEEQPAQPPAAAGGRYLRTLSGTMTAAPAAAAEAAGQQPQQRQRQPPPRHTPQPAAPEPGLVRVASAALEQGSAVGAPSAAASASPPSMAGLPLPTPCAAGRRSRLSSVGEAVRRGPDTDSPSPAPRPPGSTGRGEREPDGAWQGEPPDGGPPPQGAPGGQTPRSAEEALLDAERVANYVRHLLQPCYALPGSAPAPPTVRSRGDRASPAPAPLPAGLPPPRSLDSARPSDAIAMLPASPPSVSRPPAEPDPDSAVFQAAARVSRYVQDAVCRPLAGSAPSPPPRPHAPSGLPPPRQPPSPAPQPGSMAPTQPSPARGGAADLPVARHPPELIRDVVGEIRRMADERDKERKKAAELERMLVESQEQTQRLISEMHRERNDTAQEQSTEVMRQLEEMAALRRDRDRARTETEHLKQQLDRVAEESEHLRRAVAGVPLPPPAPRHGGAGAAGASVAAESPPRRPPPAGREQFATPRSAPRPAAPSAVLEELLQPVLGGQPAAPQPLQGAQISPRRAMGAGGGLVDCLSAELARTRQELQIARMEVRREQQRPESSTERAAADARARSEISVAAAVRAVHGMHPVTAPSGPCRASSSPQDGGEFYDHPSSSTVATPPAGAPLPERGQATAGAGPGPPPAAAAQGSPRFAFGSSVPRFEPFQVSRRFGELSSRLSGADAGSPRVQRDAASPAQGSAARSRGSPCRQPAAPGTAAATGPSPFPAAYDLIIARQRTDEILRLTDPQRLSRASH
eukprot:TRINITY_DN10091_c0_g1_i1.p1 TRINITY_DN10091_c0_g1~~TRINITY_DN10091_c0_g1_i1.p1  ORF type:complete len:1314 (+),score=343.75 TRINITY_DN10091_c0_g1_i1:72-3944(+)